MYMSMRASGKISYKLTVQPSINKEFIIISITIIIIIIVVISYILGKEEII